MYNKLFTKILDSSIWLQSVYTRLVWLTLIAAMDEDGFCPFAAVGNLAARARVPVKACQSAIDVLEGPDPESSNPANEGRRIERVPGGWLVLNAKDHREMVTRAIVQAQTRERVRKHRAKVSGNAPVTVGNGKLTPSEAESDTEAETEAKKIKTSRRASRSSAETAYQQSVDFLDFWTVYPNHKGRKAAMRAWVKLNPSPALIVELVAARDTQKKDPQWTKDNGQYVPMLSTWLNGRRWEDEPTKATRPKSLGPAYEAVVDWQDECQELHQGRCGNAFFHAAKREQES